MKSRHTGALALALASTLAISAVLAPAALAAETGAESGTAAAESVIERKGGRRGGRQGKEAGAETGIGRDAAKEAALADAGLAAGQAEKIRARFSAKDDTAVYLVNFAYEDAAYFYKIDAETGAVLDKRTGSAGDFRGREKGGKHDAEDENAIGSQAAKEAALTDAGLDAGQITRARVRYVNDDDSAYYKVSFRHDGQKYSYRIDAVTGAVLERATEAADA